MSKKRARSGRQRFDVGLERERLVAIAEELESSPEPRLSWRTRNELLLVLSKILDQESDTRVKLLPWQVAMLAAELVDEHKMQPKVAVIVAIELFAPERNGDPKFRAYIERTYSRLRAGKNPARPWLLPVLRRAKCPAWRGHITAHVSVESQAG